MNKSKCIRRLALLLATVCAIAMLGGCAGERAAETVPPAEAAAPSPEPVSAPAETPAPTERPAPEETALTEETDLPRTDENAEGTQILLCGETHSDADCIARELELWDRCYRSGVRDLFIETPYYTAQFLNRWMCADSDEILDRLYEDAAGTQIHSQTAFDFYRTIKRDYPETVFHGTDVGHQYESTGRRYLALLEEEGLTETQDYALAQEAVEQGKIFYVTGTNGPDQDHAYRERTMTENFIRELDSLSGKPVMGIYGTMHTATGGLDLSGTTPNMIGQLRQLRPRLDIESVDLTLREELYRENLTVGGKSYEAVYFGMQDLSATLPAYRYREFWRLEDAYEDCLIWPTSGDVLPYNNYPMEVEEGQVFVIDYTMKDGTVVRKYYRSDGLFWRGMPSTSEFLVEEPEG